MKGKKHTGEHPSTDFEKILHRLEEIVQTLEKGGVTLDEAMTMYEEGIGLSRQCLETLRQAEIKLKRLTKDVNGSFELTEAENEE